RQRGLNRVVALKMILSGAYASPEELARFRTEAEAAARLQQANIVQIYEVGEQDGWPFLAMEYVSGGSLEKRLTRTPWPPRQAAQLVQTLASAVDFAHQHGVLHRDLKPGNILLAGGGNGSDNGADATVQAATATPPATVITWQPKISDFGLAKQLGGANAADCRTQTGAI